MAKLENMLQRIHSLYSKGAQSDDSRLMNRHIYDVLLSKRALLIYQKINKRQTVSLWNYVTLPCIKLIEVPKSECPCLVPEGCTVLRSEHPLPKPIESISQPLIYRVSSVDGSVDFDAMSYNSSKWKIGNKYTSAKPGYYIHNNYLYITNTRRLKAVSVTGVFFDPVEVANYPSYCGKDDTVENVCTNPFELEFPIDEDLVDAVVEMAYQEISISFQPNEDRRNDANDGIQRPYQNRRPSTRRSRQRNSDDEIDSE